ncbi:MAG: hypothetical protein J1E79_03495 [Rikenella sp.]|nr:hypothetical protein [Rikenella sp.]
MEDFGAALCIECHRRQSGVKAADKGPDGIDSESRAPDAAPCGGRYSLCSSVASAGVELADRSHPDDLLPDSSGRNCLGGHPTPQASAETE